MKILNNFKIIFFLLLNISSALAQELVGPDVQDTSYWHYGGINSLTFSQTSFSDWAAGGTNSIALGALTNFAFSYKKDRWLWENIFDAAYGVVKNQDQPIRKNEDRFDFLSRFGYAQNSKLFYSARMNLKSQFAPGYKLPNDSVVISRFMAPGWLLLSLGLEYKPVPFLSINLSPIASKFTFVLDQDLANTGAYGVDPAEHDAEKRIIKKGKTYRAEFGALASVLLKKDFDRIKIQSRLDLFSNYTDKIVRNRSNIDINWETLIVSPVTKWLSVSLMTHLIYDHDVRIPITKPVDGKEVTIGHKPPKAQLKQILGVGLTYTFGEARK